MRGLGRIVHAAVLMILGLVSDGNAIKSMETGVPLPSNFHAGHKSMKCGVDDYFFTNRFCPWQLKHAPTVELNVEDVIRVLTKPESCFYDPYRYALKYVPNGKISNGQKLLIHTTSGRGTSLHPQCSITMKLSVFYGTASMKQLDKSLEQAAATAWKFVKPLEKFRPKDQPRNARDFEDVRKGADYATLAMGPRLKSDGDIEYDPESGLPQYLDNSRDGTPAYCGDKSANLTRWIQFRQPGTFVIAYTNVQIHKCVMGIHYSYEKMMSMLRADRFIIVHVK